MEEATLADNKEYNHASSDELSTRVINRYKLYNFALLLFFSALLIWLYFPFLSAHYRESLNPYSFSDDARHHITPFLTFWDGDLFKEDYPTKYYLDALSPTLWKATYYIASFFVDPVSFSKFLPYPLWLITIIGLAIIVYRIGGLPAAFGTLLFAIPAPVFFDRMTGGLSRCFAFPLLTWGVFAVMTSRHKLLGALTVLAAGFYPTPAIILGLMLFSSLLCRIYLLSFSRDSIRNAFILLFLTSFGSLVMFLPPLVGGQEYGHRLTESDIAKYPEVGEGGRYGNSEHGPHISYLQGLVRYTQSTFLPRREPYLESFLRDSGIVDTNRRSFLFRKKTEVVDYLGIFIILGISAFIFFKRNSRNDGLKAIVIFAVCAVTAHFASVMLYPHLFFPQRYIVFTTPLLALLLYGAGLSCLSNSIKAERYKRDLLIISIALLSLFFFGGPSKENEGYISADKRLIPLYKYLEQQPKDTLIAGWPKGPINNVAYLSRRPTFLSAEINQAFHQGYLEVMRERMAALLPAYFSKGEIQPILDLRDKYSVKLLLIDLSHFKNNSPKYFLPFSNEIPKYLDGAKYEDFLLPRLAEKYSVYRNGELALLDLLAISASD